MLPPFHGLGKGGLVAFQVIRHLELGMMKSISRIVLFIRYISKEGGIYCHSTKI